MKRPDRYFPYTETLSYANVPYIAHTMYLWGSCHHTFLSEHQIQWKISILLICISLETESIIATCWKNMPISDYLCCYFECFQFSWRRSPWLLGDWKPLHEQILPGEIQNLDHIMTVAVMFTRGWLDWISLDGVRSENLKVLIIMMSMLMTGQRWRTPVVDRVEIRKLDSVVKCSSEVITSCWVAAAPLDVSFFLRACIIFSLVACANIGFLSEDVLYLLHEHR